MLEKYKATIQGDKIVWDDEMPKGLTGEKPLKVEVSPVKSTKKLKKPNGKKMAEALEAIAAGGGIKSIADPVRWQREIRKDRPLPGRK